MVALLVDWVLSTLVAYAVTGAQGSPLDVNPAVQLGVFAVVTFALVATLGTTVGHRLLGMQVRRLDARRGSGSGNSSEAGAGARSSAVGAVAAAVRTVLLCLVIPAVVWDSDGRGVHDRAAGTVLVRTR
ncbi:hypothetical protein GCM10025865_25840 [Paraoerskovia sediminicola]|uniref:RDD family protein n=1 Tax=Paraoerskovia sediminicola TaxID=1138587 RepID=A0ABM8G5C3_9CELL|nr:hypothetical protein GCM10025865_25840 [Paraoerskovia sediminicola]